MAPVASDNLTVVLHKIGDLRLEQRPIPVPKDDEVLLEMACVGICGSDVHYLVHGRIGDFIVKEPMVCGHEASGVVSEVGKNVKNLKKGDRVAIEPGVPCRRCQFCKEGNYHLCKDVIFCATPPVHGNLTRYYCHAADFCFKLPDHVSLEEGALLEPLSVGVHACRKAGVQLGSNVLITGAGTIGIVTLIAAKAMGASSVIMTDVQEKRLKLAKEFGADHLVLVKTGDSAEHTANKIRELIGDSPDKTIDCSGFESSVQLAIEATKEGGKVVLVGMGAPLAQVSTIKITVKELEVHGSFRYANDYPVALALVASKKAEVRQLITHRFKIEETINAFETAKSGDALKVMIHVHKDPSAI
uniref:Sorbitol dehydrogenase n=1 Tax=Embidopsocus sp. OG4250 TaxID=2530271 RepID=A0A481SZH2_9NEOP|nr:alcohol dehydrogenase [Embidopsocus sp. OG4250]